VSGERLRGRRALVTGAGGGIGGAIAVGIAREGASVAVHDVDIDAAERTAQAIGADGGTAVVVAGDVRRPAEVEAFVQEAAAALDGIDLLVNNAGLMSTAPFLEMTPDEWGRIIDTNLTGYFLVGQAVARRMAAADGGSIVMVSSTRQVQSWPGSVAYCSSKGGISMLVRSMALELAPHRIRVNSIAPGTFVTDLNRHYLLEPEFRAKREATIPLGRYGELTELVGGVVYLAGSDAAFTTGASIMIDGGQTLW
jgi:NAD(P)-dependent dehydrogenase (short-subunit alcohol dehydrogenase family)